MPLRAHCASSAARIRGALFVTWERTLAAYFSSKATGPKATLTSISSSGPPVRLPGQRKGDESSLAEPETLRGLLDQETCPPPPPSANIDSMEQRFMESAPSDFANKYEFFSETMQKLANC